MMILVAQVGAERISVDVWEAKKERDSSSPQNQILYRISTQLETELTTCVPFSLS